MYRRTLAWAVQCCVLPTVQISCLTDGQTEREEIFTKNSEPQRVSNLRKGHNQTRKAILVEMEGLKDTVLEIKVNNIYIQVIQASDKSVS